MKKRDSKAKTGGVALKVVGAPPAGGNGGGDSGIDFESVRVLARIATEFDLSEIEVDRNGHMRVRRGGFGGGVVAAPTPASAAAGRPIGLTPTATPVDAGGDGSTFISSPFVGTFYRAPSPEAPMFVEAGQQVRKGQVVCIVEAMKLMNEIEAEAEGRIAEILVENGAHIEYGQPLFRVTKT